MKHPLSKANVAADYPDYLRDESRKSGRADSLSFPTSADEVVALLAAAQAAGTAVTVQGGRTGITGGAVPEGGHILNLSRMRRVLGMAHDAARRRFTVTVEPGLPLADLRAMLRQGTFDTEGWTPESLAALKLFVESGGQFWPPDPTETSASIGGMAACNASGACSFRYGATRRHIDGIRVALADGSCLDLRRGRDRAVGRAFRVTTDRGRVIEGTLPAYTMPAVKNASGYFAEDDMDLVDLFVGAEGTLGVITRLDLVLQPEPPCRWGVTAFFPTEAAAIRFVKVVRRGTGPDSPVAVELFDEGALRLLRGQKAANPAFAAIPAMPESWNTAVYVEYHGAESSVSAAVELLPATMVAAGGTEDATWIAMTDAELERLKYFRHAVPEAVNLLIDERRRVAPGITSSGPIWPCRTPNSTRCWPCTTRTWRRRGSTT